MTDRDLLQMALNALTEVNGWQSLAPLCVRTFASDAEENIRARLAQPEPEPVAWLLTGGSDVYLADDFEPDAENLSDWTPLYTAPPQREWVGLTRDAVEELFWPWKRRSEYHLPLFEYRVVAADIEAALKEKNG